MESRIQFGTKVWTVNAQILFLQTFVNFVDLFILEKS